MGGAPDVIFVLIFQSPEVVALAMGVGTLRYRRWRERSRLGRASGCSFGPRALGRLQYRLPVAAQGGGMLETTASRPYRAAREPDAFLRVSGHLTCSGLMEPI